MNRFILLLRTVVYPYEGLDLRDKFDETSLSDLKDINKPDCKHAKILCNVFEMNNLADYHDLYVQNDNIFLKEHFRKKKF